jgi:alpha-glucosidase
MTGDGNVQADGEDLVTSYTQFIAAFPWHVRLHNMNPLDTHDIPRFKTFTIKGAQKVAAAMQFTFPGIPVIWAGDEFGLDGFNGENSRTPMPWNNERKHDKKMLPIYRELTRLRKENSALNAGSMRFIYASAEAVVYVREDSKQSVVVCVTRGKDENILIPKDALPNLAKATNIFGGGEIVAQGSMLKLPASALSANIWSLRSTRG